MKRKQIKLNGIILLIMMVLSIGCSKDDDTTPITVTVEDFSGSINENPDVGQVIGTITAKASSGELTFTLTSQSSVDAIQVHPTSGELTVKNASAFDFENLTSVTGLITVKSGNVSKEAKATITIGAINDEAPEITAQAFIVKEDIADNINIGVINATDIDKDDLTFILIQNSNDLFELTDTGELSLAADKKLDFETVTSHILTVEVSDGTHKVSADITVTVENVEESFITTWKTVMANEEITIGINLGLKYNFNIDWGDGTIENNQTNAKVHTYATAGTYTIKISGVFPALIMNSFVASKLLTIEQWGDNQWESMDRMFYGCVNMINKATDVPDLSEVINMDNMFFGCGKFNADLNNWDVSNVTSMIQMFDGTTSFNGDISQWDVSNVVKMVAMFNNATSFNGDLSQWNVSKVTGFNSMFNQATSFDSDLSQWDVSKATNMAGMFRRATSFSGDLSNWNVQNVRYMDNMLDNTSLSIANYDALLIKWSALPDVQSRITFGVQGLTYCNAGVTGRNNLINNKNWTITGDQICPM